MFRKFLVAATLAASLIACDSSYDATKYGPRGALQSTSAPKQAPESTESHFSDVLPPQPTPKPQITAQAPRNEIFEASTLELVDAVALSGDQLFIIASLTGFLAFLLFALFISFVVLGHAERRGL
jgi:hypothetical protein